MILGDLKRESRGTILGKYPDYATDGLCYPPKDEP